MPEFGTLTGLTEGMQGMQGRPITRSKATFWLECDEVNVMVGWSDIVTEQLAKGQRLVYYAPASRSNRYHTSSFSALFASVKRTS
jgi:hypothetical protein